MKNLSSCMTGMALTLDNPCPQCVFFNPVIQVKGDKNESYYLD